MNMMYRYTLFIILFSIFLVSHATGAFAKMKDSDRSCDKLFNEFVRKHGRHVQPTNITDALVFFLHVPRTAGKTYATCFMRPSLPPSKRCSPSYDFLRYNISVKDCKFIVSHDDYSIVDVFPKNTLVITQMRDPLSRILSSYEFALEVGARRLKEDEKQWENSAKDANFVNTMNVWPWSYLVPYFRGEVKKRMAILEELVSGRNPPRPRAWEEWFDKAQNRTYYHNRALNQSVWELPVANLTLNPYDNELVIPLREWIESPIAYELIHDGATLQLLGLTNYSHWPIAGPLRSCYFKDQTTRDKLIDFAKQRLTNMKHVGLQEDIDNSVSSLAASLGRDLNSTAWKHASRKMHSYDHPDFNSSAVDVRFNSSQDMYVGSLLELSVHDARVMVVSMEGEVARIKANLTLLEPRLQELVEQEAAWLEEQDKKGELPRAKGKGASIGAFIAKQLSWMRAITVKSSDGSEMDDSDQEEERIESPWSDEIEALDDKVYAMQQRRDALEHDIKELESIPEVKGPEKPVHRAKLILSDETFLEPEPLGMAFRNCTKKVTTSAAKKRKSSLNELRTPWDESFQFTSAARKALDPNLVERIRELNKGDFELWQLAKDLLARAVAEQKEAGTLQVLPPPLQVMPPPMPGDFIAPNNGRPRRGATVVGGRIHAGSLSSNADDAAADLSHDEF